MSHYRLSKEDYIKKAQLALHRLSEGRGEPRQIVNEIHRELETGGATPADLDPDGKKDDAAMVREINAARHQAHRILAEKNYKRFEAGKTGEESNIILSDEEFRANRLHDTVRHLSAIGQEITDIDPNFHTKLGVEQYELALPQPEGWVAKVGDRYAGPPRTHREFTDFASDIKQTVRDCGGMSH